PRLVDSATNKIIWSKRYRGSFTDIRGLQDEITTDVLHELGLSVGDDKQRQLQRYGTSSGEAYDLYLKGDYYWNQRTPASFEKAIEYFQRAVDLDPKFALAYTGVANTYNLRGAFGVMAPDETFAKARPFVETALRINPNSAEAHNALAFINWKYDWDWEAADREFKEAIRLNPNYALAHHWYGLFLPEQGKIEEGIAEEERALQLDPFSISIFGDRASIFLVARRYDDALEALRKVEESGPLEGNNLSLKQFVFLETGQFDKLMAMTSDASIRDAFARRGIKG